MAYTKYNNPWVDSPGVTTPITAAALDHIESGIAAAIPDPGSATTAHALVWNGSAWVADTIKNARIDAAAAISVSKLAAGSSGDILSTSGGVPTWIAFPSSAMVQIYDSILAATAASFDIQSISQAYTSLRIVASLRVNANATSLGCGTKFNNDSGSNYADSMVQGGASPTGNEANSVSALGQAFSALAASASVLANAFWDHDMIIPNYARTDRIKTISGTQVVPMALTTGLHLYRVVAGVWNSTAALNRITITPTSGQFVAGCRVTIYGIL